MVEVAEAAVVISSLRWKEVVRRKIRHRRSRGRGRSGLALIPLGWREQQRLPGSWTSHVSTGRSGGGQARLTFANEGTGLTFACC